jgi:hypothetical protein
MAIGSRAAERSYRERVSIWNSETSTDLFCYRDWGKTKISEGVCCTIIIFPKNENKWAAAVGKCRNNGRQRQSGGGSIPSAANWPSLYSYFLVVIFTFLQKHKRQKQSQGWPGRAMAHLKKLQITWISIYIYKIMGVWYIGWLCVVKLWVYTTLTSTLWLL